MPLRNSVFKNPNSGGNGGGSSDSGSTAFSQALEAAKKQAAELGRQSEKGLLSEDEFRKAIDGIKGYSKALSGLSEQYGTLQKARPFAQTTQDMAQIQQQQKALLDTASKLSLTLSKGAENFSKFNQASSTMQGQMNKAMQPADAGFNSAVRSTQFAGQLAQVAGGQLYQQGTSAYNAVAQRYSINPVLADSQRALNQANFGLGEKLSGYEAFKNNVKASAASSALAPGLAMAGDIGGTIAGVAGTGLQLAGAAKMAGISGSALANVGKAGLLVGAPLAGAAVGLLAGSYLKGEKPEDVVEKQLNPEQLGHRKAQEIIRSDDYKKAVAKSKPEELKAMAEAADKEVALLQKMEDLSRAGKGRTEEFKKASEDLQKHYDATGQKGKYEDLYKSGAFNDADMIQATKTATSDLSRAIGGKGTGQKTIIDQIMSSPEFKLAQQKMANQIADFAYESNRQEKLTKRDYAREKEDLAKAKGRTVEDYQIQQYRFGVQRGRLDQDYTKSTTRLGEDTSKASGRENQDYYKNIGRVNFDLYKTLTRQQEDYTHAVQANELQVYRIKRDSTTQAERLDQDYAKSRSRLLEDSARNLARLEEDSSRSLTRLTEDTNTARLRSQEDYSRNSLQLARQSSRSMADLNTSFKDSVIGLFAPGVASSKAYQYMKLVRDYSKQKTRLGEDTQFAKEGLDLSKRRSDEDITKGEKRGKEDIERGLNRGREDIEREKNRGLADLDLEKSRASFDLLKQTTDALKDSEISLRDINIQNSRSIADAQESYRRSLEDLSTQHARTMDDIALSFKRGTEDANLGYSRSLQDLSFAQDDASRQFGRSMEDFAIQSKRSAENFQTAMEDINHARETFVRDFNLNLQEQAAGFKDLVVSTSELSKVFADTRAKLESWTPPPAQTTPGNGKKPDGSNAAGLPRVPFDGYLSELHEGETVLPKGEAERYRQLKGADNFNALTVGMGRHVTPGTGSAGRDGGGGSSRAVGVGNLGQVNDLHSVGSTGQGNNDYTPPAGYGVRGGGAGRSNGIMINMPITVGVGASQGEIQRRADKANRAVMQIFTGIL